MLIIVRDLLILVLCGAITEVGTHQFITGRSYLGATIGSCGVIATTLALFALIPELKDVMRTDSYDYTTTFAVAMVLGFVAVGGGGLIGFRISDRFLSSTEPA